MSAAAPTEARAARPSADGDACGIVVLQARGEHRLAKHHRWTDTGWSSRQYDKAVRFDTKTIALNGFEHLVRVLERMRRLPDRCVIRNRVIGGVDREDVLRRGHDRPGEPAVFEPHPTGRPWVCIDVDGLEPPSWLYTDPRDEFELERLVRYAIGHLPSCFHGADCYYQWSSSAGVKPWCGEGAALCLHLWFWFDRFVCDQSIKAWAKRQVDAGAPIDLTVFNPVQVHYTADPLFEGRADPLLELGSRAGVLRGEHRTVDLPHDVVDGPTWAAQEAQRDAEDQARRAELAARFERSGDDEARRTVVERYARSALRKACAEIVTADKYTRHETIMREARSIGGYAGAGVLDREHALAELEAAAEASGSEGGARTARELFEHGFLAPRDLSHIGQHARSRRPDQKAQQPAPPPVDAPSQAFMRGGKTTVPPPGPPPPPESGPPRPPPTPPPEPPEGLPEVGAPGDDTQLSIALEELLRRAGPVLYAASEVWQYNAGNGLWEPRDEHQITTLIQRWSGWTREWIDDATGKTKRHVIRIGKGTAESVRSMLCARVAEREAFTDAAAGFALADGVWIAERDPDTSRRRLVWHEHRPGHRLRHGYPWTRAEVEAAEAPLWFEQTMRLCQGHENAAQLLAEWAGATVLGLATKYERAIVLQGPGNDGKSKWLEGLQTAFPPNAVAAPFIQDLDDEYARATIEGKLLCCVADLPPSTIGKHAASAFKLIASGEGAPARMPHKEPFTLRSRAGWIMSVNDLPPSNDGTDGFWRRMLLYRCGSCIRGEKDPMFADRLRREAKGILRWMIAGAQTLFERGDFVIPEHIAADTAAWREDSSADPWDDAALEVLDAPRVPGELLTAELILGEMAKRGLRNIDPHSRRDQTRLGRIIARLGGWERTRSRASGRRPHYVRIQTP